VMLLGIALGLWMIGNLYDINSHIRHKTFVRITAVALTTLICWFGYDLAGKRPYELPWEPFSEAKVESLLKQKKTVLVDFTAKWCINCHVNEYVALNTKKTLELVQEHGVVPLVADFSNESPEIKRWLTKFEQIGVPLTVIFPGGSEREPIVLTGVYTQGMLLQKLNEAVGSPAPNAAAESDSTVVR
jgi:suppressor for copper-sensitivity B